MPRYQVPDRAGYFALWSGLHGDYDPARALWPRLWLSLSYFAAAPLARLGVPPNLLTAAGVLVSAGVAAVAAGAGHWVLVAAVLTVASGLLDSVDGAVAAMTGRSTPLGYVLDSAADRVSDGLYLLALWLLGGSPWLCLTGWAVTLLQEYIRARAAAAGMAELGVVTVAERPTRVIVTALTLLAAGALPAYAARAATVGAGAWLLLAAVGLVQLLAVVSRRLSA